MRRTDASIGMIVSAVLVCSMPDGWAAEGHVPAVTVGVEGSRLADPQGQLLLDRIQAMRANLQGLRDAQLQAEQRLADQDRTQLQYQLGQFESQLELLRVTLAKLEAENTALLQARQQAEGQVRQLGEELDIAQHHVTSTSRRYRAQELKLERQLKHTDEARAQLVNENAHLLDSVIVSEQLMQQMTHDLEQARAAEARLTEQVDVLRTSGLAMQVMQEQQTITLGALHTSKAEAVRALETTTGLLDTTQATLATAQQELAIREQSLARMTEELNIQMRNNGRLAGRVAQLEPEVGRLELTIADFATTHTVLTTERDQLLADVSALKRDIARMQETHADMLHQEEEHQATIQQQWMAERATVHTALQLAEERLRVANTSKATLEQQLQVTQDRLAEHTHDNAQMNMELAARSDKVTDLRSALDQLRIERASVEVTLQKMHSDLSHAMQVTGQLQGELQSSKQLVALLQQQLETLNGTIRQHEDTLASSERALGQQVDENMQLMRMMAAREAEIETLRAGVAAKQQLTDAAELGRRKLEHRLENSQETESKLMAQAVARTAAMARLEGQLSAATAALSTAHAALRTAEQRVVVQADKYQQTDLALSRTKVALAQARDDLENLTASHASLRTAHAQLTQMVDTLRAESSKMATAHALELKRQQEHSIQEEDVWQERYQTAQLELIQLRQQSAFAAERLAHGSSERIELAQALDISRNAAQALEGTVSQLREKNAILQTQITEHISDVVYLRDALTTSDDELREQRYAVTQLREQLAQTSQSLMERTTQLAVGTHEREALRTEVARWQSEAEIVPELQQRSSLLAARNTHLEEEIQQLAITRDEQERRLAQVRGAALGLRQQLSKLERRFAVASTAGPIETGSSIVPSTTIGLPSAAAVLEASQSHRRLIELEASIHDLESNRQLLQTQVEQQDSERQRLEETLEHTQAELTSLRDATERRAFIPMTSGESTQMQARGTLVGHKGPRDLRVDANFNAAMISLQQHNYTKAIELLEKASTLAPDDAEVQYYLAVIYRDDMSDGEHAAQYYDMYYRLEPSATPRAMWLTEPPQPKTILLRH